MGIPPTLRRRVPRSFRGSLRRPALKDLAVGLSLANLCFLEVWEEILRLAGPTGYYLRPSPAAPWAVIVNVALLGSLFALGVALARTAGPRPLQIARWLFLLTLFIPLDAVRSAFRPPRVLELAFWMREPAGRPFPAKDLVPILVLAVFARWPSRSVRYARAALLFFAPFTLVTVGRAAWLGATYPVAAAFADRPPATPLPWHAAANPPFRVVVLVFDEWDQRLTFVERPAGLKLPELDRLRRESLYAANATPPAWQTETSLPPLITGRPVAAAEPAGPSELALQFAVDRPPGMSGWSQVPNLFERARELGVNVGLVGWYHPYCRVIPAALTRCVWEPYFGVITRGGRGSLGATMVEQLRSLSPWDDRLRHIESYRRLLAEAASNVTDRTLGLVFVHWPVPHHPYIYDGARGRLTQHHYSHTGYVDHLRLVDQTVGEVRRALEGAGLWNGTTLVLTSDHAARAKDLTEGGGQRDERVPFLWHVAGADSGVEYTRPFGTVILADLVLAALQGQVSTAGEAARWLDRHAGPQPVLPPR